MTLTLLLHQASSISSLIHFSQIDHLFRFIGSELVAEQHEIYYTSKLDERAIGGSNFRDTVVLVPKSVRARKEVEEATDEAIALIQDS